MDLEYSFSVVNSGEAILNVSAVGIAMTQGCDGDEPGIEPFTLTIGNGVVLPVAIDPRGMDGMGPDGLSALGVTVQFAPQAVSCDRAATVTITSDDPERPALTMTIRVTKAVPNILANPTILDLGYVMEGQQTDGTLNILNSGLGDLFIDKIAFSGDAGFSFLWGCARVDGEPNTKPIGIKPQGQEIGSDHCEPLRIPRNSSFTVPVRYAAGHGDKANAMLTLFSNDPRFDAQAGKGLDVELRANWGGPCLKVTPTPIDFGSVVVPKPKVIAVYLESCGDEDVSVSDVRLSEESSQEFFLQLDALGAFNAANPLVLSPGDRRDFRVAYVPQSVQVDDEGKPLADIGTLLVDNSSPRSTVEVPLTGLGVEAECAVCEFEVLVAGKPLAEGSPIVPMTRLQFKDRSYDPMLGGGIAKRLWTVDQPQGSQQIFDPSAQFKDPTFTPNVIGTYRFMLTVENEDGCRSDCERIIEAQAPEGCLVELTWNTPADLDQTDQCWENADCGADMDLHVVHPFASGSRKDPTSGEPYGYFDGAYDCFWNNFRPTWRMDFATDPRYQPSLDLDDTDGAGPEIFTYTIPEPDRCYRVGVHYYDDHGFGASYPTIRVFINDSTPVYERKLSKAMQTWDMWDVGRVCCTNVQAPFQEFSKTNGDPVIVTKYNPLEP